MLLSAALQSMSWHRSKLLEPESTNNPSYISEHTHRLAQYIASAEESLADLEAQLEVLESDSFRQHIKLGKSANAAKESVRREFTKERADIIRATRLVSSGWKLVNSSQSRVKHLIAEANNQI